MRGDLTQADDRAEHRAALEMIYRHSPGSTRKLTLGTDKGFDAAEFVADLLGACVTPHIAQKSRYSAIDGQIIRQEAERRLADRTYCKRQLSCGIPVRALHRQRQGNWQAKDHGLARAVATTFSISAVTRSGCSSCT